MKKLCWSIVAIVMILNIFVIEETKAAVQEILFFDANNPLEITVMNYHHFGYEGEYPEIDNIRVTPELFREQLQDLKDNGYTTITLREFIAYINGTGSVPKKSVLLTVDDGFKSVYQYAYPILKEMEMNAVIFPITSDIERGIRKGAPMMTFEELGEIVHSGVFEVGNHTYDLHWRGEGDKAGFEAMVWGYDKTGQSLSDEQRQLWIQQDSQTAEQLIYQSTNIKVDSISYPYGAYDEVALRVFKELGYTIGFTINNGYTLFGSGFNNPLEVNRIGINDKNSAEWIIKRLEEYHEAAKAQIDEIKDIRVNVEESNKQITIEAWSESNQGKQVVFEIYKNENGIRHYDKKATTRLIPLNAKKKIASTTEVFSESEVFKQSGKGNYSMKVTLTLNDNTQQIEWVDFTYK